MGRVLCKALEWAELYHMKLLLDFHAAPGSQNGLPSSGKVSINSRTFDTSCSSVVPHDQAGKIEWYKRSNVEASLDVIETVASVPSDFRLLLKS